MKRIIFTVMFTCLSTLSYAFETNAEHQLKELNKQTNPEIRQDIINNLLFIRKLDNDFDKKYPDFIKQYETEIKVLA